MKWFALCLLPMLSAAAFAGSGNEPPGDPLEFTIYTDFAKSPSAPTIHFMQAEMESIMASLDLRFNWHSLAEDSHRAVFELLVVRFRGACQLDVLPPQSKPGPLGWTHVSDGRILPFTDVDCDRIREIMATPLAMAPVGERARLLGRAMARVVAHELYHFLANTAKHSSSGIAKRSYSATDLAATVLLFDPEGLSLLREHTPHLVGEAAPGSP
jgi:hypothetical protein